MAPASGGWPIKSRSGKKLGSPEQPTKLRTPALPPRAATLLPRPRRSLEWHLPPTSGRSDVPRRRRHGTARQPRSLRGPRSTEQFYRSGCGSIVGPLPFSVAPSTGLRVICRRCVSRAHDALRVCAAHGGTCLGSRCAAPGARCRVAGPLPGWTQGRENRQQGRKQQVFHRTPPFRTNISSAGGNLRQPRQRTHLPKVKWLLRVAEGGSRSPAWPR
jgi:hypothetical protein